MLTKYFFVISTLLFTISASAENHFSCRCVSKSPGVGRNEDKICSYDCSLICHEQYSRKPILDAPNWRTEVRFSEFMINHSGSLSYEESTEMASI